MIPNQQYDEALADNGRLLGQVRRLEAENARLLEQLGIATEALEEIVHDWEGCEVAACRITPGVVAADALTQMSTVE